MRTLVRDRSEWEGRVFTELAKTILRQRPGDGVVPQVIKKTHKNMGSADTEQYVNFSRYLTKVSARHEFENNIWTVDFKWSLRRGRRMWTLLEIRFGRYVGSEIYGD